MLIEPSVEDEIFEDNCSAAREPVEAPSLDVDDSEGLIASCLALALVIRSGRSKVLGANDERLEGCESPPDTATETGLALEGIFPENLSEGKRW